MALTHLEGNPVNTCGNLPEVGSPAPEFTVAKKDLSDLKLSDLRGKQVVLNITPSVDTGICASSVRRFNQVVAQRHNTIIINVSMDLPFALDRFCGAAGITHVITTSAFRSSFGKDYGVELAESPMAGLLARCVIVIDEDGVVSYVQLVPEIKTEPDYDAVIEAL